MDCVPLHPPAAVQEVAFVEDHVSVALEPNVREVGLTEMLTVGAGALTVKASGADVPPPGDGFTTVMFALPAEAISEAAIEAVSWDALTYVVERLLPFQSTVALETKLVPFTVSVKALPPAVAEAGEAELIEGTGFDEPLPQPTVASPRMATAKHATRVRPSTRVDEKVSIHNSEGAVRNRWVEMDCPGNIFGIFIDTPRLPGRSN